MSSVSKIISILLIPLLFISCASLSFRLNRNSGQAELLSSGEAVQEKPAESPSQMSAGDTIQLSSQSFEDYGFIDPRFSLNGENISPELHWKGIPKGTSSIAVIVYDFTPEAQKWLHWGIYNIPASAKAIPAGASLTSRMPKGAVETINSYDYILDQGSRGWAGPSPPRGRGAHEYRFMLLALNQKNIELKDMDCVDAESLYYALEPLILAETFITGLFEEP